MESGQSGVTPGIAIQHAITTARGENTDCCQKLTRNVVLTLLKLYFC